MKSRKLLVRINRYLGTAIVGGIFYGVWVNVFSTKIIAPIFWKGNVLYLILYLIIYCIVCELYQGYDIGHRQLNEVIFANYLAIVLVNFLSFIISSLMARVILNGWVFILMTIGQMVIILFWGIYANKMYYRIYGLKKLLFITNDSQNDEKIRIKFMLNSDKFEAIDFIDGNIGSTKIIELSKDYDGVILKNTEQESNGELIRYFFEHDIRLYIYPDLSDIFIQNSEIIMVDDTPILYLRNHRNDIHIVKRCMDIIVALIGIVIAIPLMLIFSLLIVLEDGFPVIYTQNRIGQYGKLFRLYKLRSMIKNADEIGEARTLKEDERVTKVGKVMRNLRIDELPQLFNVLIGNMSIVGPRPERPELVEEYKKTLPEYDLRLKVKAGITGYAQVMGKYNTTPADKLRLDLIYIESYSIITDFKIILLTVKAIFTKQSTEGFD